MYNRDSVLNCVFTGIIAIIGFLNCYLITAYETWRIPVPIINNFCILAFFPLFNTYTMDDLAMIVIPMHIFHVLTMMITTNHTWQIILMCFIQFTFDYAYLAGYLVEGERLYSNRFNLGIFGLIYLILSWGVSK